MKKLKYFLIILVVTLISAPSVSAEVIFEGQRFSLLNRLYSTFPFETWYDSGENTTYTNTNYVELPESSVTGVGVLPKYIYAISCSTGGLNLATTSISKGDLSYYGTIWGSSCSVNGYNGQYKLNRWLIKQWNYYESNGGYVYGVKWSINIHNELSYPVYVRYESIFLSNELINDFSSDYLLGLLIEQNSSLRSQLNEVKTNTNETNNKLNETNQELGKVNDNITNDDVGGVDGAFESFESFVSENSTITQLITMPITLYTSILNGVQSSCQPFSLGNLFGINLTLPCINIGNYLGSTLWSMIDIIISGFAIFSISKKLIKIFNNFSTMKEGDVIDD